MHLADGTQIAERLDNPNAHYLGNRPFARPDYIDKLAVLTEGLVAPAENERFLGLVDRLPDLTPEEVGQLNLIAAEGMLEDAESERVGIL